MSPLDAILGAVKTTLRDNVPGQMFAYDTVPEVVNVPAVVPTPDVADFDVTMGRGTDTWEIDLDVLVTYGDAAVAQHALNAYVTGAGDKSIRAAIFAHRTLGLDDCSAHISGMSDYGAQYEVGQTTYLGAKLRLVVHTSGTA